MKLYLVRHAQRDSGINFDRLMTIGIWQSYVIARYFKDKKIDVVYCSPQKRARETMKAILPCLSSNIKPKISSLVRQKSSPEEVGKDAMKAYNMKIDSDQEVEERVRKFLSLLKKKHSNENVLVISHKEVSRQFVKELIPSYRKMKNEDIRIASASISFFDFDKNFVLKKYNLNKITYSDSEEKSIRESFERAISCYDKFSKDYQKNVQRVNLASRKAAWAGLNYKNIAKAILDVPRKDLVLKK